MKNSKRVYRKYGFVIDKSEGVWSIADRQGAVVTTAKTLVLARAQAGKLLTAQLRAIVARNDARKKDEK